MHMCCIKKKPNIALKKMLLCLVGVKHQWTTIVSCDDDAFQFILSCLKSIKYAETNTMGIKESQQDE